jgi:hypothetical protein
MSLRLVLPLTAAALLLANGPADSQTIHGRLLEDPGSSAAPGTLVVLLDASGAQRGSVLTDEDGRFVLRAPGTGSYRLRAERIGVRSSTSPDLQLTAGQTLEYTLRVGSQPVLLAPLVARAGRARCARVPDSGPETITVWEEARKALNAARHTGRGSLSYRLVRHARELSLPALGVQVERADTGTWTGTSPFVSVPVERLGTDGFVVRDETGTTWYAPDAEVLLSEAFLEGHCFRLVEARGADGLIGLAFVPVRGGRNPDVEGTLWLDPVSAELRHLEFAYTRLDALDFEASLRGAPLGGRVDFVRLPSGGWIASRWSVRMPMLGKAGAGVGFGSNERRLRVVRIAEQGGHVTRVTDARGRVLREVDGAGIVGTVHDSIQGVPLAGARVFLVGTDHSATTDSTGAYRLTGPGGAEYGLTFSHPAVASLGYAPPAMRVTLRPGATDTVHLAVPPMPVILASRCAATDGPGVAAVSGVVTNRANDSRIAGADVIATWSDAEGDQRLGTTTGPSGRYLLCVPVAPRVRVEARFRDVASARRISRWWMRPRSNRTWC